MASRGLRSAASREARAARAGGRPAHALALALLGAPLLAPAQSRPATARSAVTPFFAALRSGGFAALGESALVEVVVDFAGSPEIGPKGWPADLGTFEATVADLRAAVRRVLGPEYGVFLAYSVAKRAVDVAGEAGHSLALRYLEEAERAYPEEPFCVFQRQAYRAELLRGLGRAGEAQALAEALVARAERETISPYVHSGIVGTLAEIAREEGRLDEAFERTRLAVTLAHTPLPPEAPPGLGEERKNAILRAQSRLSEIAITVGAAPEETCEQIDQALALLDRQETEQRGELLVYRGYAEALLAPGKPELYATAQDTLEEALKLAHRSVHGRIAIKLLDLALDREDLPRARTELARCERILGSIDEGGETPGRGRCELIGTVTRLRLFEKVRGEALQKQILAHGRALRGIAAEWASQPPRRSGIGFLQLTLRRELLAGAFELARARAAEAEEDDGGGEVAALQALLDMQVLVSLARARGAPACTVREVQTEFLGERHAALVYLPARRHTYVFLVERERVALHRLPAALTRHPDLVELRSLLALAPHQIEADRKPLSEAVAAVGKRVRERLLPAEFTQRLAKLASLTVVGGDLIAAPPLEALPLADGRLLGEAVAVDHLPSLPLGVALVRSQRARFAAAGKAVPKALLVACTDPEVALAARTKVTPFTLPAGLLEAFGVYPDSKRLVTSTKATLKNVTSLELDTFDVVHFFAHGAQVRGAGQGRGLVLRDEVLWRTMLDGKPAKGLVLVSSCGAGEGPRRAGEGDVLTGYGGGFLWDGADGVISSAREILVLDHVRLVSALHAGLARGLAPAEALRAARADLARGSDLWARTQRATVQAFGATQVPRVR